MSALPAAAETIDMRQRGWGPTRKQAAVSFTFDNLGEAAELEFGKWPADQPVGRHYTVTEVIPALLARLHNVEVTFFIEGWNAVTYPATLHSIVAAGHEVGIHGWRHEIWKKQSEETQRAVFGQAVAAMRDIGIQPQGFRPPGGEGSPQVDTLLRNEGMSYVSDVGAAVALHDGIAHLPFAWRGVDGVFLEPDLGKAAGVTESGEGGLDAMHKSHRAALERAKTTGGHVVFIFHPFLLGKTPGHLDALFELVEFACADKDLWVAPCKRVAAWLRDADDK